MKKLTCIWAIALLALGYARAETAPTNETTKATSPGETPQLEVKSKSSFAMDESGRNPFWPVGWRPANKVATSTPEHAAADVSPTAFSVTSITVDTGGRFAIINGKVMNEGQVFGLQMGNQTYQLTVKAIQDGQVVLQRRDQEIIVPLRRR